MRKTSKNRPRRCRHASGVNHSLTGFHVPYGHTEPSFFLCADGMATSSRIFEGLKILIIEDKEHMRALLRRLLNHIGVRITHEAPDGTAALDMLLTLECDLILSDLSMAP